MIEKLEAIEDRYIELTKKIADPEIIARQEEWRELTKEHYSLEDIVTSFREYKKTLDQIQENSELLEEASGDTEMEELFKNELEELEDKKSKLEEHLKILLIPVDPNDERNVIMEIRAGTGGDEAALFAGDLFRMYSRYAENKGWKAEIIDSNPTELGGFKEVIFEINGTGAYSRLKYESGVHRVQRVPQLRVVAGFILLQLQWRFYLRFKKWILK